MRSGTPSTSTGVGGLERPDDEGDQVRGHDHGRGEPDPAPAARLGRLLDHLAVGPGSEGVVDDQGDLEGRLEGRLVPAREGPPGVGRLHLGGGDDVLLARLVGEGRPVEAVQHVVEDAAEGEVQGRPARRQLLGEGQRGPLLPHVEVDVLGGQGVAVVGLGRIELGEGDVELGALRTIWRVGSSMEMSISTSPVKVAAGRFGVEHQPVGVRTHRGGEPVGGGGVVCRSGHPTRLPSAPWQAPLRQRTPSDRDAIRRTDGRGGLLGAMDVVTIGNALVDVLASASDDDLVSSRPGEGDDGARRPRALESHLRGDGPDDRGIRGLGRQHRRRDRRTRRPGGSPRPGGRRPSRPGLRPRHPLGRRALRPDPGCGRPRSQHRALFGAGDRGRRAHHGHPPGRGLRLQLGGPARRLPHRRRRSSISRDISGSNLRPRRPCGRPSRWPMPTTPRWP